MAESGKDKIDPAASASQTLSENVLELRDVSYFSDADHSMRLRHADLVIRESELVVVKIDRSSRSRGFTSMLQGIQRPQSGLLTYRNQEWTAVDFEEKNRMRSEIGRVFDGAAWIENMNLRENIGLSALHHGVAADEIETRVATWLKRLDIAAAHAQRPASIPESVLQVYQWVRAFVINPKLLLLERPMFHVESSWIRRLMKCVQWHRNKLGTAVLWITPNEKEVRAVRKYASHCLVLDQARFLPFTEAKP